MKVAIIGSGVAGLSCACRLKAAGYDVDVFESADGPGGKLRQKVIGNYRFDLGPSLFTMPHWIDEIFSEAEKSPREYFEYEKLDIVCNYFYADGKTFSAYSDERKLIKEMVEKLNANERTVFAYRKKVKEIFDITAPIFLHKSLHKISSYLNVATFRSVLKLGRIEAFRTMNAMNNSFFKNRYLNMFYNRFATYNGSNPYKAPGTLNLISHIENGFGAYLPKNGMYAITNALHKLATDIGVNFYFNRKVDEILVEGKSVKGIKIGSEHMRYDIVVSNMDVYHTYHQMLPNSIRPTKILNQEKSSSALIFYWGIKKSFDQLDVHNIFFTNNYEEEFNHIFTYRKLYIDPTIYINITSKKCKNDAPESCENWFVMINVHNNDNENWADIKSNARTIIIDKLSKMLKVNLENLIDVEDFLDPVLIEQRTSSFKGALYGNASNNAFAAFFRHSNFSNKIKNLYFCGGSVHPGGGIPLAAMSGKIVSDLVKSSKL